MVLNQLVPTGLKDTFITNLSRITGKTTDFIRGNPIVSTAAIGIGVTGLIAGAATTFKRRKAKRKVSKRRKTVSRNGRRRVARAKRIIRRRRTHRSPRHRGHRRVNFVTATGKRVNFLIRGQKRSPSHRKSGKRKQRRFVKGSAEAKRFMARLRGMRK